MVARSDYSEGRVTKIIYGRGFAHEFRIHADTEIFPGPLTGPLLKQRQNNILYRSRQYRTADNHDVKSVRRSQQIADLFNHSFYLPETKAAIFVAGYSIAFGVASSKHR